MTCPPFPSSTQSRRAKERWSVSCSSVTWVIKTAPPAVKYPGVQAPAARACAAPPPRAGDGRSASSAPTDPPFLKRWRPPWSAAAQSALCNISQPSPPVPNLEKKKIYCKINKTQIELIFIKGCFLKKETAFMMLLICVIWKVILYRRNKNTQINIPENIWII